MVDTFRLEVRVESALLGEVMAFLQRRKGVTVTAIGLVVDEAPPEPKPKPSAAKHVVVARNSSKTGPMVIKKWLTALIQARAPGDIIETKSIVSDGVKNFDFSNSTIYFTFTALVADGLLKKVEKGKYEVLPPPAPVNGDTP